MPYQIATVTEVSTWLTELRGSEPYVVALVDEALAHLEEEGRDIGPPMVVPVGTEQDPKPAVDIGYQRHLEQLQVTRRGQANVAMSLKRADLQLDESKAAITRREDLMRQAIDQGNTALAAHLRKELSSRRDLLERLRRERDALLERERQLESINVRAAGDSDLFRTQGARVVADQLTIHAGAEPESSLLWELRPARLWSREVRIVFASLSSGALGLLYADVVPHDSEDWLHDAIPEALDRLRTFEADTE